MKEERDMNNESISAIRSGVARIQGAYGVLDEEMAVIMRMSRPTFRTRKLHPETYRIEELLKLSNKFHVSLSDIIGGEQL